jgi:hypothetical protein
VDDDPGRDAGRVDAIVDVDRGREPENDPAIEEFPDPSWKIDQ